MCGLPAIQPFHKTQTLVAGQGFTSILGSSNLPQPALTRTGRFGSGTATAIEDYRHCIVCPRQSVGRESENSWLSPMATAGSADAPSSDQEGTYTAHQKITCHYHVYAPTTVHISPGEARCVTESTSSTTSSPHPSPAPKDIDGQSKTESHIGKREAILQWLIRKLVVLLQKLSPESELETVLVECRARGSERR